MVLQGFAADAQLRVVQAADTMAQGSKSGWQLTQISPKKGRDAPKAATPRLPRGLCQQWILLNRGVNIGQSRLEGPDLGAGPAGRGKRDV
jgi:hypothetical protein